MAEFEGPWSAPRPQTPPPQPKQIPRLGFVMWVFLLVTTGGMFFLLTRLFPGKLSDAGDQMEAMRLFGLLALVSSGLVSARRVDLGTTARYIAGWAAIFAVVMVGYTYRDDLTAAAIRLRSALIPAQAVTTAPRTVVIGRSAGDAFEVQGQINGQPAGFVVDTGASDIVLSPADAERAGLNPAALKYSDPTETANGVGHTAGATVASLSVGSIRMSNVPVQVNQAPMSASLLGMPFLKRLDGYEVTGDRLTLHGHAP